MTSQQQAFRADSAATETATPGAGPLDADWQARIEALRRLAKTEAASALEQAQAALEELRGQQRLDLESRLSGLVGLCHLRLEQKVQAAVQLQRAVSLAQGIERSDLEAHHLATLGLAYATMAAFSDSINCYERAMSLHKGLPTSAENDLLLAKIMGNFGSTHFFMGLPDKALPLFRQTRDLFLRLGRDRDGAGHLGNCAKAEVACAEQLSRQPSAQGRARAEAAARRALALAEQVVSDPSLELQDPRRVDARLTRIRTLNILGDYAGAIEELDRIDHDLTGEAHGSFFRCDRRILRARLLRLTGRTVDAMAELQAEPLDDLPASDRVRVLEELVSAQEAAGDFAGALESFRQFHELTLRAREQATEQRGQVLNARLELERAQHKAEIERLRAEELTLRNEDLARQAIMDALTGLPNRRGLDAALAHRMGDGRSEFACVLADIDHFKRINDRYSHLVGDEVLRRVGALIRQALRNGDVAARYGGEEFALLLDRLEERQAVEVCERLRSTIAAQPWGQIADGLAVTISLGVAMRRAGDSSEALLGRADRCLYAAKAAGRDRVAVVAPAESEPPAPG